MLVGRMRRRLDRSAGPEAGMSAVMVLFSFLALSALVMVTATYAAQAVRPAGDHLHWTRAGAAAESGLADYQSRLQADPRYWLDVDCGNPALVGQDPGVVPHTCPWTPGEVGWSAVEDGTDPDEAPAFHYEVTAAPVELDDFWAKWVTVTVTGRSGGTYRTLQARFARASTTDYVLYQDYGLVEGRTYAEAIGAAASDGLTEECGQGGGIGSTRRDVDREGECENVAVFTADDVVVGDVLMQDRAVFGPGAQVEGQYATAHPDCAAATSDPATWGACAEARDGGTTQAEQFLNGVRPQYSTPLTLPPTTAAYADIPGCHYFGATRIIGEGEYMRVWSRDTLSAVLHDGAVVSVAPPGRPAPDCGNPGLMSSTSGDRVKVPDGMAIYVRTSREYPGLTGATQPLNSHELGGTSVHGYLPLGAYNYFPTSQTSTAAVDPEFTREHRWRKYGNLYLEGYFSPGSAAPDGRGNGVTFVADQSVVIVGDVLSTGADATDHCGAADVDCAIGIVAGRSVEVFRDVMSTMGTRIVNNYIYWDFNVPLGVDGSPLARTWSMTGVTGPHSWLAGSGFDSWPHRYVDHARGAVHPSGDGVQIQAAIQVLSGSMSVQSHWADESTVPGTGHGLEVAVHGSLATRFGGLTRGWTGSPQYPELIYDRELKTVSPPYLLPFTEQVDWETRSVTELATPADVRS